MCHSGDDKGRCDARATVICPVGGCENRSEKKVLKEEKLVVLLDGENNSLANRYKPFRVKMR